MFKNISFDNFKCLSGKKFHLSNVNVFTGYNGRGKSSVIQAILMISQSVRKGNMNSIANLHVNGDFVKLGDFDELLTDPNMYKFGLDMTLSNNTEDSHNIHLCYEMTDDYKVGRLSECVIDDSDFFDTASSKPRQEVVSQKGENGDLKQLPVYLYNQFQNVHYVAADRKGPVKFVERDEIPDFFKVGADGSRTINTLSAYQDKVSKSMNISATDEHEYELQEAVNMWIDEIMHGGSVSVAGNASRVIDEQGNSKKSTILKLGFGMGNKGITYPSYHVGFGYSYILPIVVTALIAKENDVVIIENPEAHLHPEAQTRLTFLLAKLGSRGVQVFVETHSEHVINGFRLASLKKEYALKNDEICIFFFDYDFQMWPLKIEPTGRIPKWPERFFDQYQKELAEILKMGSQVSV